MNQQHLCRCRDVLGMYSKSWRQICRFGPVVYNVFTNSVHQFGFVKCVVYSPLLYVVLHKRKIIVVTTDSNPNMSTHCHATTTSRVWLTNTMSFFLNQSVESEQEQKYVLSRQTFQADIMLLIDFQKQNVCQNIDSFHIYPLSNYMWKSINR